MPNSQSTTPQKIEGVKFNLPMPVSNNAMYMPANGKIILSPAARSYYTEMQNFFYRHGNFETLTGRLSVNVWIYEKDLRRRDINNLTKSLFDALQKCKLYEDDSQIDETHIFRGGIVESPYVCIEIKVLCENDTRVPLKVQRAEKALQERFDEKVENLKKICKKSEIQKVKRFSKKEV